MIFSPGQKIVFAGDSITDAESRIHAQPYGYGYMNMVRSMVTARYPEHRLTFVNKGVGGNGSPELAARWDRDVIPERPDWVSVLVGIGDATRFFTKTPKDGIPGAQYEENLRALIERTQAACGARFILMEPFLIYPDDPTPEPVHLPSSIVGGGAWDIRQKLEEHIAAVHRLAMAYDAVLVRTQQAWDMVLKNTTIAEWSPDCVHPHYPYSPGYAVIALAWLRAAGFVL